MENIEIQPDTQTLYTPGQVCKLLQISPTTLHNWDRAGIITSVRQQLPNGGLGHRRYTAAAVSRADTWQRNRDEFRTAWQGELARISADFKAWHLFTDPAGILWAVRTIDRRHPLVVSGQDPEELRRAIVKTYLELI